MDQEQQISNILNRLWIAWNQSFILPHTLGNLKLWTKQFSKGLDDFNPEGIFDPDDLPNHQQISLRIISNRAYQLQAEMYDLSRA